jgi:hypothetical protein
MNDEITSSDADGATESTTAGGLAISRRGLMAAGSLLALGGASGVATADDNDTTAMATAQPHFLAIEGQGPRVEYTIKSDRILAHSDVMGTVSSEDTISDDGHEKNGAVGGGADSTLAWGPITHFSVSDPDNVTVYLDGAEVSPGDVTDLTAVDDDSGSGDGGGGGSGGGSGGTSPSRTADGIRVARPGEVQAVIDETASAGGGPVTLDASEEYDPDEPWTVKRGVRLDCNFAPIRPTSDHDLFHVYPGTGLENFDIDLDGAETYTSEVFRLDTAFDGKYGAQRDLVRIDGGGGYVDGAGTGEGTLVHFDTTADNGWMAFAAVENFAVRDIHTVARFSNLDTRGESPSNRTWINSNRVNLTAIDFTTGVHFNDGRDAKLSNMIYGHWQCTGPTDTLWEHEHGNGNVFWGHAWDFWNAETAMWMQWAGNNNKLCSWTRQGEADLRGGQGNEAVELLEHV